MSCCTTSWNILSVKGGQLHNLRAIIKQVEEISRAVVSRARTPSHSLFTFQRARWIIFTCRSLGGMNCVRNSKTLWCKEAFRRAPEKNSLIYSLLALRGHYRTVVYVRVGQGGVLRSAIADMLRQPALSISCSLTSQIFSLCRISVSRWKTKATVFGGALWDRCRVLTET